MIIEFIAGVFTLWIAFAFSLAILTLFEFANDCADCECEQVFYPLLLKVITFGFYKEI